MSGLTAYQFFMANAGYSYDLKTETPLQGRQRCAKYLAYCEARARDAGACFAWEVDLYGGSSADWIAANRDGGKNRNPWRVWTCTAYDASGNVFASLCGIDFGRDGTPHGSAYRRVVEAELACELPLTDEE